MICKHIQAIALPQIPLVEPQDDLIAIILEGVSRAGEKLCHNDIVVLAQKVVSKVENRYVDLRSISPSPVALDLAETVHKDPRLVEVILSESREVMRASPGVLIVEHKLGFVMANAGVDASNIEHLVNDEHVLLLPENPDRSAETLSTALSRQAGGSIGVLINDSVGRAWRRGTVGLALGAGGVPALHDRRGEEDLFGRTLKVSEVALADQLAAAAALVQGEGSEAQPIVLIRGVQWPDHLKASNVQVLLRPKAEDLFR